MLSSLELTNFKAFRRQNIALNRLTLLAGLNGSGKSSSLQALAMLRQSFDTGFLTEYNWLLNGELVELGNGRDVLHDNPTKDGVIMLGLTATVGDKTTRATYPVQYDPNGDVLVSTGQHTAAPVTSDFNLFRKGFQYLRADRLPPAVVYPKSQHSISNNRFLGSRGEFSAHFLLEFGDDAIGSEAVAIDTSTTSNKLLSQTNAWMQRFSPSVKLTVENLRQTDLVQLRYSYQTKDIGGGGEVFRATNVGFGLSYSLPIVVAALAARPGDLLLIENPEAHLHPEGQLAMGNLLARAASANIQVIVETHSDHLLNGIRLAIKRKLITHENVGFRFFKRDEAGASSITSPTSDIDGMLDQWPSGFFTQWDDVLTELLS